MVYLTNQLGLYMDSNQTLVKMLEIADSSKSFLGFRDSIRSKVERSFNRKEASEYLRSDGRTIERVAEELNIDWKIGKDDGIPWFLTIDQLYAIRDALPENTALKKKVKKFQRQPHQKCQIITVGNQKGGVGKTITANTYATGFAAEYHEQFRVLLVDMDGQSTASTYHPSLKSLDEQNADRQVWNDLAGVDEQYRNTKIGRITVGDLVKLDPMTDNYKALVKLGIADSTIPNLKILPSVQADRDIEEIFHQQVFSGEMKNPYTRLASILAAVEDDFDIIIVDTPPSYGYASTNAFFAATSIIFPFGANQNDTDASIQYFSYIPETYANLIKQGHQGYDFIKILITNHQESSNSSLSVIQELQAGFGEWLFAHKFNNSEAVRLCSLNKNSVFDLSASTYEGHKRTFTSAQLNAKFVIDEAMQSIKKAWGI